MFDRTVRASTEPLLGALRALGAPVETLGDAPDALRAKAAELDRRLAEPVAVAWDGRLSALLLRTEADHAACDLETEDGGSKAWTAPLTTGPAPGTALLEVAGELPTGYHRLRVSAGGAEACTHVISAPTTLGAPTTTWGVFAPVYALRSDRDWGAGDLTDLESLLSSVAERGGSVVATLPILSSLPDDPSPYSPLSRLFWNELYCDPFGAPELEASQQAREILASPAHEASVEALRASQLVDYRGVGDAKRRVLQPLAQAFFALPPDAPRRRAFAERLAVCPELADYARFRAAHDRHGVPWPSWPASQRDGSLRDEDVEVEAMRYHLYAHWLTATQMEELASRARGRGAELYFDLPLGVHPHGYDVWRYRERFALGCSGGAPPDSFFAKGQNWSFPPLHPERIREDGYHYTAACIRHLIRHATLLRVDHVMGLHRLYWIPDGMEATDGVYVRYRAEELYAVLLCEATRAGAAVVGEDLGTVPREVRTAMSRHGLLRSYVLQYELSDDPEEPLPTPPPRSLATLNTHDMPTFASFWTGDDIDLRVELGLTDAEDAEAQRLERKGMHETLVAFLRRSGRLSLGDDGEVEMAAILEACLRVLAESDAAVVVAALEDLWGETEQQNVPGTTGEYPNWRRRFRHSLEALESLGEVAERLDELDRTRRKVDAMAEQRKTTQRRTAAGAAKEAKQPARKRTPKTTAEDSGPVRYDVSLLSDDDVYLFNEGTHRRLGDKLGSHLTTAPDGTEGTYFGVWAPNAGEISVVGNFNEWDYGSHQLQPRGSSGIWEGFVPGIGRGTLYKYHVVSRDGGYTADKTDPFATFYELAPKTAAIVWPLDDYRWEDDDWMRTRGERNSIGSPISVYELHVGSWRHKASAESLSYREMADDLVEYLQRMNFTHVEFLPVMEHPFYGSWGYQSTGYFAPTSRFGTPQDFMYLVDRLHQAGIGVILDWVPSHFPTDDWALGRFDGTHLYEHADPRLGIHPDWNSYIFNYGRNEVRSFLLSSALHWLNRYHADGIRVDAVASMLYLDYSRKAGEWIPNQFGGRENIDAIDFLRRFNEDVFGEHPDAQTIAEESTAWPSVSRPTYVGGLGFGMKWDMGWMHDTLSYFQHEPIHRRWHHNELTFRMIYAFNENFMLPLSHDEVVHGKGSLFGKMPGDEWQKFANLRALYGYMWSQPGKKLLFMGCELGQVAEWNHNTSIEWHALENPLHEGVQRWVEDLNRTYRDEPALHELDCDSAGFEWVDANDNEASCYTYLRRSREGHYVLVCLNLTPIPRHSYRVGVPHGGYWREVLNSDAPMYGGSGQGNLGGVEALPIPLHGRPKSLTVTIPPLGCVFLKGEDPGV